MALIRGDESARGIGDVLLDTPALLPLHPISIMTLPLVITGCTVCHSTSKSGLLIYSKIECAACVVGLNHRELLGMNKKGDFL